MRPRVVAWLVLAASGCFAPTGKGEETGGESTDTSTTGTHGPSTSTGEPTPTTGEPTSSGSGTGTGEPPVGCADQAHITDAELLAAIALDLASEHVMAGDRSFTRYLSLVHLHNAGLCDDEIEVHRRAVNKLCNSLSRDTQMFAPEPIDAARLLYRLDLRDYHWASIDGEPIQVSENSPEFPAPEELQKTYTDRWELLADQSPYLLRFTGAQAEKIATDTGTAAPILRGDAFVAAASRAPLYYDMLAIPLDHAALQLQLGVDLAAGVSQELADDLELVTRAGLHASALTDAERGVEHQRFPDASNRDYWRTFDFIAVDEPGALFTSPFDFVADGSQVLFTLPNGLNAYVSLDAAGQRRSSVPPQLFSDPGQSDGVARAGLSCIGCHVDGVHPVADDLRHELDLEMNPVDYDVATADQIRKLYPPRAAMDAHLADATARFHDGLEQMGLSPADPEPVLGSALAFAAPLDLRRAAAELGLAIDADLEFKLGSLGPELAVLLEPGGTLQRAEFTALFAASVCVLHTGRTRCCPDDTLLPACGG